MTGKERAEIRSLANTTETTVIIGKNGITDNLIRDIEIQLDANELIKCKVLETAMLTAQEACNSVCEALKAEPIQVVGSKFVVYRKSQKAEKAAQRPAKPKQKNPVQAGIKRRREAMKAEREKRNEYFKKQAIEASIERSRAAKLRKEQRSQH